MLEYGICANWGVDTNRFAFDAVLGLVKLVACAVNWGRGGGAVDENAEWHATECQSISTFQVQESPSTGNSPPSVWG